MILGLRLLPYVADKPALHCQTCQHGDPKTRMSPTDYHVRQLRGCPYLPPVANTRPLFELPDADVTNEEIDVCPGYTIGLHEVAEVVHYRPSWSKGYLAEHIGEDPTPAMLEAQNTLEGAINAKQAADMKRRAEEAKTRGE